MKSVRIRIRITGGKPHLLLVCPNTNEGAAEASRNKASYEEDSDSAFWKAVLFTI